MKKLLMSLLILMVGIFALPGCRSTSVGSPGAVGQARQALEDLPEPTFNTVQVYVHDLSALGVSKLVKDKPETKVPLRVLADSALSVLTTETVSMIDVIMLSQSLDEIKAGNVKTYLNLGWTLLELNGVIRRDDVTAVLTKREQTLLIALFRGIRLGTGVEEETEKVLNSVGPRW